MGFNYGLEKKRFDQRWEALEREYRAAGMEETAIQELYAYDYDMFKNERRYRTHTQENTGYEEGSCDSDADSPLSRIFIERFSMTMQLDFRTEGRYGWMDELDSEELTKTLKKMPEEYKEILTLMMEERTQAEIAAKIGTSQAGICRRIKKLRELLKKFA